MKTKRVQIYFSGMVQGVGFRYVTHRIASGFNVHGYVRNLSDGRVLVDVSGEKMEIEEFLSSIKERMGEYIRDVEIDDVGPANEFSGFDIRF